GMACCVCVLVCPAAKLPSEGDGSKYVPSRCRPLAATRAAGRRAGDRHAPSHHVVVVVVITTMNDCATRTLYDAHHWCPAARRPAQQAPRHTRTYVYCVHIYTVQPHTHHTGRRHQPPPAPPAEKKKTAHYICAVL